MTRRTGRRLTVTAAVAGSMLVMAVFVCSGGVRGERRVSNARWAKAAWGVPQTRRQVEDLFGGPGRVAEFRPRPSDPGVVRLVLDVPFGYELEYNDSYFADPSREFRVWYGMESYYLVIFESGVARWWHEMPMRDERATWFQRQLMRLDR